MDTQMLKFKESFLKAYPLIAATSPDSLKNKVLISKNIISEKVLQ